MQMGEWPFYLVGLALAGSMLAHWLVVRRMFAGSGRFTAIIDRIRQGPDEEPEMSADEMMAALRAATIAEFGDDAIQTPAPAAVGESLPPLPPKLRFLDHGIFLVGLVLGGTVAVFVSGEGFQPSVAMRSTYFSQIFGDSTAVAAVVMAFGGVLVGFGTRMAGGCTTGHGLCGVSRFQLGSLVSTGAFFGGGVVVSLILGAFLS
jgi:uncharacterized membrane protein YedE/YeeE